MTREEIIAQFRVDNPEITERVMSDPVLHNLCLNGDKLICAITRCIVGDYAFDSVVSTSVYDTKYDITSYIPKFYDIDDMPGGGVSFDDTPLTKTTVSELDHLSPTWRTRSAGIPKKWYRRGKYLYFDRPIATAALDIKVYAVLISDDFNNDDIIPYNQLTYLEPFHPGILEYLKWQAKRKVGKPGEASEAQKEFIDYTTMMKKQIGGNIHGKIYFQPPVGRY